jgi:hypothetical protein
MRYVVHLAFTLFFLICTLEYSFGQGDLSATLKGQNQSTKLTVGTIELPSNQATKTGSINALIETGNTDILANPSFEHTTADTSWTNDGTEVGVAETSVVLSGKKSLYFNPSSETINLVQSSTAYQAQFADGVQCLAMVNVKSAASGVKVCSVQAGTVSTTNCVDVVANSKWGLYKVPFICGATSNGISISSTGSNITGAVYVDAAFVGAVDLKADVDQSRIVGQSYFAGTTNCTWDRNSTSVGAFTADADCPGPTIEGNTSMGSWQTTDSNLPRQTINNLPLGRYKVTFFPEVYNSVSTNYTVLTISDGTTTCEPEVTNYSNTIALNQAVSCFFEYNSSGNRSFELYGAANAGTISIPNNRTSPRGSTKFILEYFGSGSVYTSTNADTDWASCGHTTSDFTGFGTVSAIETQCKREGSDLLMRGKFTSGADSAVEARLNLKLGGSALTSASSPTIGSLQVVGHGNVSTASTTFFSGISILIEPSVGYVTFGRESSTTDGITKTNANNIATSGRVISLTARIPISGWTQSNLIIGQFNGLESCTDSYECTDTFSAKVSSTGVVSDENIEWITGNATITSTSTYALTFKTGLFTTAPNCFATINQGSSYIVIMEVPPTTTGVSPRTLLSTTAANGAVSFTIICQKQGADYIGKTGKAVASDQNIATPGVTKVKACYYAFGGASATLASPTVCSSGTCTEVVDTCGTGSPPAFGATGIYTSLTFASGTFANNAFVKCECVAFPSSDNTSSDCILYRNTGHQTWAANSNGGFVTNIDASTDAGTQQNVFATIECTGAAP